MGVLAIVIVEVCVCLLALEGGAHLAIALQPTMSKLPRIDTRKVLDPLVVFLAWGIWIETVIMAIWPLTDLTDPQQRNAQHPPKKCGQG